MIKPMQATPDGDAYESNKSEGIWTAGINLPFRPESIHNRSMDPVWHSRIECHGESKEDAEELRDAVLTVVTQQVSADGEALARRFHEAYERLAPTFGYETRTETRQFDPTTPNGRLMLAVCSELANPPAPTKPVPYIELVLYEGDKETEYPGYHRVRIPYDAWSWEIDHNGLLTNRIDIVFPQSTNNYYKAPLTHIRAWIDGKSQMIQLSRALILGPEATTPVFEAGQLSLATESPQYG